MADHTDTALADELERFANNVLNSNLGNMASAMKRAAERLRTPAPVNAEQPAEPQPSVVEKALEIFNGGVVKVADANNPRGFTMRYLPKQAMCAALAAAKPEETELLREAREVLNDYLCAASLALSQNAIPYDGDLGVQTERAHDILAAIDATLTNGDG